MCTGTIVHYDQVGRCLPALITEICKHPEEHNFSPSYYLLLPTSLLTQASVLAPPCHPRKRVLGVSRVATCDPLLGERSLHLHPCLHLHSTVPELQPYPADQAQGPIIPGRGEGPSRRCSRSSVCSTSLWACFDSGMPQGCVSGLCFHPT